MEFRIVQTLVTKRHVIFVHQGQCIAEKGAVVSRDPKGVTEILIVRMDLMKRIVVSFVILLSC